MNSTISKSSKTESTHYEWGDGCSGWFYHQSSELTVIRESMPAGKSEILHYHENTTQFFYIISGVAEIVIEGKPFKLKSDEGISVKPGQKHFLKNTGDDTLEFIVVSQPDSHNDRINV